MGTAPSIKRFTVITGHYGVGKTNLSINLALDLVDRWGEVTLVDLDIVNPYFRSSDYVDMLAARGVRVISPTYAGTTLETPSISAEIYSAFEAQGAVLFDVGGDDAGATTLGSFAHEVRKQDYDLIYVVNRYRNLTPSAADAFELLGEIEFASHLSATGIINNSHLQGETTVETVLSSLPFAREAAQLSGLPLVATTAPAQLASAFSEDPASPNYVENPYPIEVFVRPPWDREDEEDQ